MQKDQAAMPRRVVHVTGVTSGAGGVSIMARIRFRVRLQYEPRTGLTVNGHTEAGNSRVWEETRPGGSFLRLRAFCSRRFEAWVMDQGNQSAGMKLVA